MAEPRFDGTLQMSAAEVVQLDFSPGLALALLALIAILSEYVVTSERVRHGG